MNIVHSCFEHNLLVESLKQIVRHNSTSHSHLIFKFIYLFINILFHYKILLMSMLYSANPIWEVDT